MCQGKLGKTCLRLERGFSALTDSNTNFCDYLSLVSLFFRICVVHVHAGNDKHAPYLKDKSNWGHKLTTSVSLDINHAYEYLQQQRQA